MGRGRAAQVLDSLGIRRDPLTRRLEPPEEATIRRVLESVDAAALDAAVSSWLGARLRATPRRLRALRRLLGHCSCVRGNGPDAATPR